MKRRRQEIRRRASERLAAELGLSVKAMERQAHQMARAAKELGVSAVRLKLERHGIKITRAEELAIARVHQILTIAMADLTRIEHALAVAVFNSMSKSVVLDAVRTAHRHCASARPTRLCERCLRGEAMPGCGLCHGRGWV